MDGGGRGREIRWTSTTTQVAARDHAIAQWNALGAVNIAPDTSSTDADLKFEDVRRLDVTWTGTYACRWILIDLIQFNRSRMAGFTDAKRKTVALHELGHALGLGHNFSGQVMDGAVLSSAITPQSHDIADYCHLWNCGGDGGAGPNRINVPPRRLP